jgi:hypothetical protein
MYVFSVRTPKEIAVKLIEACNARQVKPSVIIREALSRYFDTPYEEPVKEVAQLDAQFIQEWRVYCSKYRLNPWQHLARVAHIMQAHHEQETKEISAFVNYEEGDIEKKKRIKVNLTPTEYAALEIRAREDGYTMQGWLVFILRLALTGEPTLGKQELKAVNQLTSQIRALGLSVNRLVKQSYTEEVPKEEIRFAIATLNNIRQWQTLVAQLVWQNTRRYNIIDIEQARKDLEARGLSIEPRFAYKKI